MLSWLKERGVLTPAQYEGALHKAQRTGDRVEEAGLRQAAVILVGRALARDGGESYLYDAARERTTP